MTDCAAVFDVVKTNLKLVAFDREGKHVAERSHCNAPLAPDPDCPYLRLDTERAWRFLVSALKEVGAQVPIETISISAHGASGVLVTGEGVALPPMDNEFDDLPGSTPTTTRFARPSRRARRLAFHAA